MVAGLIALCTPAMSAASDQSPPVPPDAILMFVASWCAPCHEEVRTLPALTRAASPARVLVVPIDARRATARLTARVPQDQLWKLEPEQASALMRLTSGSAVGLPTSVATDRAGKVCGLIRRALNPGDVRLLRAGCQRGSSR